jgi:hypothetical protein
MNMISQKIRDRYFKCDGGKTENVDGDPTHGHEDRSIMIKTEDLKEIDISKISDPSMQLKILAEKLRGKISDISKDAGFNQNIYNGRNSLSSDRLAML